jgi:hypothetical protein
MVLATVSIWSHQHGTKQHYEVWPSTLPGRRRSASTAAASETSPCRQAGYSKRRARSPTGHGDQQARHRGNRDPRALGATPRFTASAQLVKGSVGGPHRRGDGSARSLLSFRSPARGPIQVQQGRATAAARQRGQAPQECLTLRGRPGCPSSASGSPHRAGVSSASHASLLRLTDDCHYNDSPGSWPLSHASPFRPLARGFLLLLPLHDVKNLLTSNGTCLRPR